MSRYVPLSYLREHFRVVDPGLLSEQEINKHWDPFCEREDS